MLQGAPHAAVLGTRPPPRRAPACIAPLWLRGAREGTARETNLGGGARVGTARETNLGGPPGRRAPGERRKCQAPAGRGAAWAARPDCPRRRRKEGEPAGGAPALGGCERDVAWSDMGYSERRKATRSDFSCLLSPMLNRVL